jgi:hypothetical protein
VPRTVRCRARHFHPVAPQRVAPVLAVEVEAAGGLRPPRELRKLIHRMLQTEFLEIHPARRIIQGHEAIN